MSKKSLIPLLLLCASFTAAAPLPKTDPVPGGLVTISLPMQGTQEPKVYFSGKRVTVIPEESETPKDWLAVVGIPLNAQLGNTQIKIVWAKDATTYKTFEIKSKDYPTQHLTIKDKRKVNPNQEDLDRIWVEQKRINQAKASWLDNIPDFDMHLPVKGPLSSQFGLKRFFNHQAKNPHSGLDIAAPSGTIIHAPADGTVVETGDFFYSGNCVFIDHGRGLVSFYGHMSRIDVKVGQTVKRDDVLGMVGATGRVTGAHLHWAIGLNGTWVNPDLFLLDNKE